MAAGCIGYANKMKESKIYINNFSNSGCIISKESEASGVISHLNSSTIIAKISNSINNGEIQGYLTSGGFIGYCSNGLEIIISNSYNTGNVSSINREAGGIIGDTDSNNYLINIYNTGECASNSTIEDAVNGSAGGIIGSSYDKNAKINIINGYNIGNIKASKNASGIVGGTKTFNNSNINNVYNKSILHGSNNNGIITLPLLSTLPETSKIKNAYYIDNVETGTNIENSNTIKITEQNINSQEFLNELNNYVKNNPEYKINSNTSIKLSKWKIGENGCPTFE